MKKIITIILSFFRKYQRGTEHNLNCLNYIAFLLGLALFEASPYVSRPVCQSVRPSVRPKSSHTSRHRIFLIFCNNLAFYGCRKVTKLDFGEKI